MSIKAFTAKYIDSWNYGGFQEVTCVVTANTESEALGFVLEKYPEYGNLWIVEEIDLTVVGVEELYQNGS